MIHRLVVGTLNGMGFDVVDIGMATTPTTEIAVVEENAAGGIIITASHNPKHWNALKLLNSDGEFLNAEEGQQILNIAEACDFNFSPVEELGKTISKSYLQAHIQHILSLDLVDADAIKRGNFKVAVDAVNSVGE